MCAWTDYLEFEILEWDRLFRKWKSGILPDQDALVKLNRQREYIIRAKESCKREIPDKDLSDYQIPDVIQAPEKLMVDNKVECQLCDQDRSDQKTGSCIDLSDLTVHGQMSLEDFMLDGAIDFSHTR